MINSWIDIVNSIKEWGMSKCFGRYYSFYKAEVIDNNDPEKRGRIKVKCHLFSGEENKDGNLQKWVSGKGMLASDGYGGWWIPEVGDTVFLEFEEGDVNFPYYSSGEWLKDKSPYSTNQKAFSTKKGLSILLDDDSEEITISNKEGYQIVVTKTGVDMIKGSVSLGGLINDTNLGITKLTVPTALGPSGVPINIAEFQKVITDAKTLFKQ